MGVKEEAGEVIAVPLKAKAKRKVFSRLAASEPPLSTSPSHFYQKIFTPPVLVAGHHHSSVLSKVLSRVCLFKMSNTCLVTTPTRYFQGFSIKFQHRHRSQIIPRHIGHQRPPRKMIPDVPLHHRLEHAF